MLGFGLPKFCLASSTRSYELCDGRGLKSRACVGEDTRVKTSGLRGIKLNLPEEVLPLLLWPVKFISNEDLERRDEIILIDDVKGNCLHKVKKNVTGNASSETFLRSRISLLE